MSDSFTDISFALLDHTKVCLASEDLEYRRFDRVHAPGQKVTSGLCLYIGLLVEPATNTVKETSNEAGLRCCGMCFTCIHLFVA